MYRTLYKDISGNIFVSGVWDAETQEAFDERTAADTKVINEIPDVIAVEFVEVIGGINNDEEGTTDLVANA